MARSLNPFSVMTRSGLNSAMALHACWIHSSSKRSRAALLAGSQHAHNNKVNEKH